MMPRLSRAHLRLVRDTAELVTEAFALLDVFEEDDALHEAVLEDFEMAERLLDLDNWWVSLGAGASALRRLRYGVAGLPLPHRTLAERLRRHEDTFVALRDAFAQGR